MKNAQRSRLLHACLVLALATVVGLGFAIWDRTIRVEASSTTGAQSANAYEQVPMNVVRRQSLLFVGDDFTAGTPGYYTYPYIVCDAFGLNCNVDAQGGTGFLNDGQTYSPKNVPAIDRLAKDHVLYDVDIVVIDVGRNDIDAGVDAYGQALDAYLTAVRNLWPTAQIVVIAPSTLAAEPYPGYAELVAVTAQKADAFGALWIDPVAEGWYGDLDLSTVQTPDGSHPNEAGHLLIGRKLAESLQHHGLLERKATV